MQIRTDAVAAFGFLALSSLLVSSFAYGEDRSPDALAPPVPVLGAAPDAKTVRFSGFFDMRFTAFRSEDPGVKEKERSGYLLEDGAVYVNYEKDKLSAVVDLPFSRNGLSPADSADLGFAKTKAQIYAKYSMTNEVSFTFGQFDTLFGLELNDSKDRAFGNVGLAYSQALPIVHTGAYVAYAKDGFTARLMAANPADRQAYGSNSNDASTEYGVTVSYANDMIRGQAGYLTRAMSHLDNSDGQRSLIDVLLGGTMGAFDLDFQYSIVKNPQKNTLTAVATDREDAGTAFLALLMYKISDDLRMGVRYEKIDKDPGASGYNDAQTVGGVVHYKVQDGFTMRLEYVDTTVKRSLATDKYSENRFDIGAIVGF